jgi:NADPH:quinone reductase-like Zn-dependent oxidoreductase/acyl carrier protein
LQRSGRALRLTKLELPPAEAVFSTLAAQHPGRATELLLAAGAGEWLQALAAGEEGANVPSDVAVEGYELRSPSATAAARALGQRLEAMAAPGSAGVALRILQIGAGVLDSALIRFAAVRSARLTILDFDGRRLERARLSHADAAEVSFCGDIEALPDGGFDLVVSAGGLSRLIAEREALTRLVRKCAGGAAVLAVEPPPSLFHTLVLGLAERTASGPRDFRLGPDAWESECLRAGLVRPEARLVDTGDDQATLLIAEAPEVERTTAHPRITEILSADADAEGFAVMALNAIKRRGAPCRLGESGVVRKKGQARTVLWLAGRREGGGAARVASYGLALRDLATAFAQSKTRLIVAVPAADQPLAQALFGFVRTLANEFPGIDFRRIELADASPSTAERLAAIVLSECAETDFSVSADSVRVLRYARQAESDSRPPSSDMLAGWLEKSSEGGLERLAWRSAERAEPQPNEVEVEVAATGLNFRDVMLALSILPDEMFEDGYAGPTLGLEFAGLVTRVGAAVSYLKPGDAVAGFGGGAFATHILVDAGLVALLPATLGCESAATVPVAFLTAYYGLTACAGLQRDEWALVHGGAGGVGLAALQIALWRGARVIVTASSPEKRALARALGAEHAFDSRSGGFVDEVLRVTGGQGVSVVLNSLAGEAMERSLGLLQPFGRFIELGKRDYLADTPIGLRPFRRNLSYFGVDLDQLLSARPETSRKLFEEVMALFASGALKPLPYAVFSNGEIVDAMRLMQQSGHVGKILVRPPSPGAVPRKNAPAKAFAANPDGVHLITGGLGGFGLAAAEWLVDRGARHLALVGRSGASNDVARDAVAALSRRGVDVRVAALDISDVRAAGLFMAELAEAMPPLAGVMHAAMTLDDGLAANLDEARFLEVLKPKVAGAEILDRLTRSLPLDYFVLFSSATTVIGNLGQGAYVAANGFLEGLARERRSAGLPALAVAWGAIADVGVVARSSATRDSLALRAGARGIPARAALDALGEALAQPNADASLVIADMNWAASRAGLPLMASPTYSQLPRSEGASSTASSAVLDLADLMARLGPAQARRAVADILVEEIGRILRMPRDDVSRTKPLAEIGLDSLMAVELTMSLETRFGLDAPLGAAAGGFNVGDLAGHLLATQVEPEHRFDVAEDLAKRHLGKANWDDIEPLMTALQEKGVDLSGAPKRQSASA